MDSNTPVSASQEEFDRTRGTSVDPRFSGEVSPQREIPQQIDILNANVELIIERTKALGGTLANILPNTDEQASDEKARNRHVTHTVYGGRIEEANYRLSIVNEAILELIERAQV